MKKLLELFKKKDENLKFRQVFALVLVIGGIFGLFAAGMLTNEKIHLAANPNYKPTCTISPVVACSPVITSKQAKAFGFENVYIGLAAFGMVVAVGMMLFAGGGKELKKWFWLCFQAGTLFGVLFVTWLQYHSLYEIGKLCLYCMLVWSVTIPIFWTTLAYNLREKNLEFKGKIGEFIANNPGKIIAIHILLIIVLIVIRFSDYFYSLVS